MTDEDNYKRTVKGLALMLETACGDFEVLQKFVTKEIDVRHVNPLYNTEDFSVVRPIYLWRAPTTIQMALAKSFLFNAVRAYRIVDAAKGILRLPKEQRKEFMDALKPAVAVRGVNEHGFDVNQSSRKPYNRPSMHEHDGGLLDETSMVISGPESMQMGTINLFDLYLPTAKMREIAGYNSMPPEYFMS